MGKIVVMGVSGSGKSVVGKALATDLNIPFIDGDDLHPKSNKEKMLKGIPLSDEDRAPWLELVSDELAKNPSLLIACSALKRRYRADIRSINPGVVFIHLTAPIDQLTERLKARGEHFMSPSLLLSQLETLEPLTPEEFGFTIENTGPVERIIQIALNKLATLELEQTRSGRVDNE